MECSKIRLLLADYSAENLSETLTRQVEEHLRDCAECRGMLAELVAAGEMVGRLELLETPAEVWQKIQARGRDLFPVPGIRNKLSLRWSFSSAVFALAILLISAILSLHFLQPRPPQIQPSMPTEIVYPIQQVSQSGTSAQFYHQHAATSSRDALEDPVSMGLMMFVNDRPSQGKRK